MYFKAWRHMWSAQRITQFTRASMSCSSVSPSCCRSEVSDILKSICAFVCSQLYCTECFWLVLSPHSPPHPHAGKVFPSCTFIWPCDLGLFSVNKICSGCFKSLWFIHGTGLILLCTQGPQISEEPLWPAKDIFAAVQSKIICWLSDWKINCYWLKRQYRSSTIAFLSQKILLKVFNISSM